MAVWKSVEYVTVSVTATAEPVTVNLSKGQDETQCVPFFSCRTTGGVTDQHQDRLGHVEIIDNAGTPAVRVTASARVDDETTIFQVFVIEWDSSITVQQVAVTTLDDTVQTVNITISDVLDQTTAFFLYSYQYTSPPTSDDDWNDAFVRNTWNGASTTSITLVRRSTAGDCNGTLYVVSCASTEFTVEHIEIITGATVTSATATAATVVMADTFLVHSYETTEGADDMRDGAWQCDLQDTTTVRVRRTNAGSPSAASRHWIQVVEAQGNEWDVQRNDALTLATAPTTDTITAIDQARSWINCLDHTGHPASVGRNNSVNGNDIDGTRSAADFSADNTVRYQKRSANVNNDIVSYEVVQFEALGPVPYQPWMQRAPILAQ